MNKDTIDRKEYLRRIALLGAPFLLFSCTGTGLNTGNKDETKSLEIQIEFSKPMDKGSVTESVTLTKDGMSSNPASTIWESDTILRLTYNGSTAFTGWTCVLSEGATDLAGNPLSPFTKVI